MGESSKMRRYGPKPYPPRSGDKKQARRRVNVLVRTGRLPHPSTLPCSLCGHREDDRRHEYHHAQGYDCEAHLKVVVVCCRCHSKQDGKGAWKQCAKGHKFTSENTGIAKNGRRFCRMCRREWDRKRNRTIRNAAFWRAYRAKKKAV